MMTREEAKEILSDWNLCHYTPSREAAEVIISALDPLEIISALRPVSREQVEKVWNGCINCHDKEKLAKHIHCWPSFCPVCGRPLTDKAVEMVMERLEELSNGKG